MANKADMPKLQPLAINANEKSNLTECEKCGTCLIGNPIPKRDKSFFGDLTHFSRAIPVAKDESLPTLATHYECPVCGHQVSMFGDNNCK